MRTIYLDAEFLCHTEDDGTRRAVETDVFDGKCDSFVEGHRLIPQGETWTREDGRVFSGPMRAPVQEHRILKAKQEEYEQNAEQIADMEGALEYLLTGGTKA